MRNPRRYPRDFYFRPDLDEVSSGTAKRRTEPVEPVSKTEPREQLGEFRVLETRQFNKLGQLRLSLLKKPWARKRKGGFLII